MLNEKIAMQSNFFIYTLLCIIAGFLVGVACGIVALYLVYGDTTVNPISIIAIALTAAVFAIPANMVGKKISKFIKQPYNYTGQENKSDKQDSTILDFSPD